MLGRQERIVSLLGNQGVQGGQQQQQQQQGSNLQQIDTFNRMEVNQVMQQQNELVRSIRDIQ